MLDSPTFSSGAQKLKKNLTETAQIMSQMADRYAKKNNNNNTAASAQQNPFLNVKTSEKDSINSKAMPSNHVGYLLDQGIILNYGGPWQAEKFSNKIELQ